VYVDATGLPVLSFGSHRIDHTSPLAKRWGGWYVSGTHGKQRHLGNLTVAESKPAAEIDNRAGQNVTELADRVHLDAYPTKHSDLVALMVFEHQVEAHNLLTQANYQARMALYQEAALNRELGEPATHRWASTTARIKSAGEALVKYLLFAGEAKLTEPIRGTTSFADEFQRQGLRDAQGRSLRDLDLRTRLFKHPCSYLVDSPSFAALPAEMREYVYRRVAEVLTGKDHSAEFAHLGDSDRKAIVEILVATCRSLPRGWPAENAQSADDSSAAGR
jgi:hypothetical protein